MSTTRIAGEWKLYLSTITSAPGAPSLDAPSDYTLHVLVANRAGVEARLFFAGKEIVVKGRVKPGTPSVVTFDECGADGNPVDDGFEAILYVPPWRPNIDYDFDILCGTAVIGENSALGDDRTRSRVLAVTGLQADE